MTSSLVSIDDDTKFHGIDERLKPFLQGWKLIEEYRNQTVQIPGTWNSEIFPFRYFEVIKKPGDLNYREDESENEKCLCLWAGWRGYDDECEIVLWIRGKAVTDINQKKVSAEIFKTGGAKMKLFYKDKLVTNFIKPGWFNPTNLDKVWIEDMNRI